MITNPLLRQFTLGIDEELTLRLVSAFDEAILNENTDPKQAVLDEAMNILRECIDEATEH
jgi:hypothetical protein